MKRVLAASFAAALSVALIGAAQAQTKQKTCNDEWSKMKTANQTAGKKYRDFQKECFTRLEAAAPKADTKAAPKADTKAAPKAEKKATPKAETKAAPKADTKSSSTEPGKPGRQAMYERERACGKDWKADKAAGKTAGQKWPQYWSECNKRKKAQGM